MIESSWGQTQASKGFYKPERDFSNEATLSNIRMMDENSQKGLLFDAIRACEIPAIKNVVQVNRSLVTSKMFGFEGADVYEVIQNSKTKRCYKYTGQERDGHFYPLHVAAEAGHKKLTMMLVKAGADINACDYRNEIPEQRCNGDAQYAFFELRGLFYEARERYEGNCDREGRRVGQGTIYYKPEGYLSEEQILFRGGFKDNQYHGHGNLYWPGTSTPRFIGRLKKGETHGYGLEFDKTGQKVYQGSFRHGSREGRGEEFVEGLLAYRGEFCKNARHGFGVAIFGDCHNYIGRFENNNMAGVGIYCHPNGDRFEGMFYNNKPDGPGSFYEVDSATKAVNATHALWQKGRKQKDLNGNFVPKQIDLPDDRSQVLLSAMAAEEEKLLKEIEESPDPDSNPELLLDADNINASNSNSGSDLSYAANIAKRTSFDSGGWKKNLSKYCKLSGKECLLIGVDPPVSAKKRGGEEEGSDEAVGDQDEDDDAEKDGANEDDEQEDMVSDVNGIHFMDFTTLFVAYLYVYSAAKVFEGRIASSQMSESFADFDAVYHLVIDAVESYNDAWEREFQLQESAKKPIESKSSKEKSEAADKKSKDVEAKRLLFMTERERRDEELQRQRSELAAKKGIGQLERERENKIQRESLQLVQEELMKMVLDSNNNSQKTSSVSSSPGSGLKIDETANSKEENEFAMELLHIIRTSQNAFL